MVNYERGVYEPSDEVRVFDGSEEDEEDVEGSRLPLLIVLVLIVLAAFGGVVYLAYSQGVARGRGETPVLTAAAGPERVAPLSPGGAKVPYQGFKVYEQPAPPDDPADGPVTTTTPTPAPAPQVAQAVPAPPPAKPAPSVQAMKQAPEISEPVKASAKPADKPAPPAAAPLPKVAASSSIATGAPRKLGAATPAPVQAAPAVAPPLAPAVIPAGGVVLQIGAYKSQAEADAAWKTYKAKHAALLSGYAENVAQADLGTKGVWYRLRIAGFPDKEVAGGLCARLKADGGACFLGK
jgi:hypothetical protein